MTEDLGEKNEPVRIKPNKSRCMIKKLLLFVVKGNAVKSHCAFDVVPVEAGNIGRSR